MSRRRDNVWEMVAEDPDAHVFDISPRPPVTVDDITDDLNALAEEAFFARDSMRHGERVAHLFAAWRLPRRGKPANPRRAALIEALTASLLAGSMSDVAASLAARHKPRPQPEPLRASAVGRRRQSIVVWPRGGGQVALTASASPEQLPPGWSLMERAPSWAQWLTWERRFAAEAAIPR